MEIRNVGNRIMNTWIYPAHGKPFLPQLLAKNKHRIGTLTLRPLKYK